MDKLEKKIRDALSPKREAKTLRLSKYDSEKQPNLYELDNFLRKAGYKLTSVEFTEGYDIPEILIDPIRKNYMHPEIYHDVEENKFFVDIKKYGASERSDLDLLIDAYQGVSMVLQHLESLDLSRLESE